MGSAKTSIAVDVGCDAAHGNARIGHRSDCSLDFELGTGRIQVFNFDFASILRCISGDTELDFHLILPTARLAKVIGRSFRFSKRVLDETL